LIEILVVIVIIALLTGILWAVVRDSLTEARIAATRATITQLDGHLQDRQQAFQSVNLRSQAQRFIARYNAAGNPPPVNRLDPVNHLQLAELMVRKDRFRAAFPQRLEDLWGFDGVPGGGDDSPLWTLWKQKTGVTDAMPRPIRPDPTENSELLYLSLTEGGSFGFPSLGLDQLNPNHLQDTDGDGLTEVVDDWGNPLRFYNWPTRLIRPDLDGDGFAEYENIDSTYLDATAAVLLPGIGSAGLRVNRDPDDPTSTLFLWRDGEDENGNDTLDSGEDLNNNMQLDYIDGMGNRIQYFDQPFSLGGPNPAQPLKETYYHALETYHIPLIVSAGPDGHTGLYEPDGSDPHNPGVPPTTADFPRRLAQPLATSVNDPEIDELSDNITNQRRHN
jgi:type II secretory pathway pseudopilin PulG